MTVERKIWMFTISFIVVINLMIYLFSDSMRGQLPLYLLSFLIVIPIGLICGMYKKKENEWKTITNELKEQVNLLEVDAKQHLQNETELKHLIDSMDAGVFSFELDDNKWFFSKKMNEMLDDPNHELLPNINVWEEKIHPDDKKQYLKEKSKWLAGASSVSEFRVVRKDDQIAWIEMRINSILNSSRKVERIVGILIDVTERKEREEGLEQMAFYDTLTNLPNRIMLKSHLSKVISRAKRKDHNVTIMFLDLDGFKQINDSLGHDAGDILLKEVANRLNESVREEDLMSRLGGDEFIVVIEETSTEEVSIIADRILQNISKPFTIVDNTVSTSPSIGISTYPEDGMDIESLIKNADKAMYFAKDKGKNNYQFYTTEFNNYQLNESIIDKLFKLFQR